MPKVYPNSLGHDKINLDIYIDKLVVFKGLCKTAPPYESHSIEHFLAQWFEKVRAHVFGIKKKKWGLELYFLYKGALSPKQSLNFAFFAFINTWHIKKLWHVIYDIGRLSCDTWHKKCDTWHVACGGRCPISQNFSSHAFTVWEWSYFHKDCVADWLREAIKKNGLTMDFFRKASDPPLIFGS